MKENITPKFHIKLSRKNKIILTLSVILLLFIVFAFAFYNLKTSNLIKIKEEKQLKVGYIPYYDITSKDTSNQQIKGFLVDLLKKVAENLDIEKVEFYETDWQNFGIGLKNHKYDLSIAGTFKTPERERIVAFTDPIFYLGNGALVKKDDYRFNSIQDFNQPGITLAVVIGEQGYEYAKKYLTKAKLKVITGPDLSNAMLEVQTGRADAALSDQYIIKRYTSKHTNTKDALEKNPYFVLPICWATRQEDKEWLQTLNQELRKLKDSGWIEQLQKQYSQIPFAKQ